MISAGHSAGGELCIFSEYFDTAWKINGCTETIKHCGSDRFQRVERLLVGKSLKAGLSGQALEVTRNVKFYSANEILFKRPKYP